MPKSARLVEPEITLTDAERADLEAEALALELAEHRLAPRAFGLWLQRYLPHVFHKDHGAFHEAIHADLAAILNGDPITDPTSGEDTVWDSAVYAYPRGHGKTATLVFGLVLYALCEWRELEAFGGRPPFVVICQDSFTGARDQVLNVRDELETNEAIRRDYGDLVTGSGRWTQADFETNEGARVKGVGALGPVRGLMRRGRRPNLILIDDLENDQDVMNPELRNKLHRWLVGALIPTGIEGERITIAVGTILHDDAVLSRLLDGKRDDSEEWLKRRFAARMDERGHPDPEGTRILWPEYWTLQKLEKARRRIGPQAFAREFQNEPLADESSLFQLRWLRLAEQRGDGSPFWPVRDHTGEHVPPTRAGFEGDDQGRGACFDLVTSTWDVAELIERAPDPAAPQVVVTGWDLAIIDDAKAAAAKDSDYYAGVSVGLTLADRLEVRRITRRRGITPAEARHRIVTEYRAVLPDVVTVEAVQAQAYMVRDLRDENPDVPIRGHKTGKEKTDAFEGVPALAALLELGRMDLCAATDTERRARAVLSSELHRLGYGTHDDTVMGLWLAVLTVRRWQAYRDRARRRRIGPPPEAYFGTFPQRVERGGWAAALGERA